jgi:carboxymethylenebutenolidase
MSIRLFVLAALAGTVLLSCTETRDSEADRMANEHEGETPTATEAARAPTIPVTADTVAYTTGAEGSPVVGYMAAPTHPDSVLASRGEDPASARLPGIVVVHEWWGLNDNIRTATRRLAGEGYRALAVDLYEGATARTADSARALMQRAMRQPDRMQANLHAADEHLRTDAGAPRVAVLGWCFGGGRTFNAVATAPQRYNAAVAYYGAPAAMTENVLRQTTTPLLAHFGRKDQAISLEAARDFEARFADAGAEGRVYLYDAGHAFANPSGERYVPAAADAAWARTTAFLDRHLSP